MAKDPNEAAHSDRGPSSSHRWMHCPGSVAMCEGMPHESSAASTRGTGAHALAVEILAGQQYKVGDPIGFKDNDRNETLTIDEDLLEGVMLYVEHLRTTVEYMVDPRVFLEQVVKLNGEKGTSDCIIIDGVTLHVMDYKNGRVAVRLKEGDEYNSQLMIYAASALKKYDKKGDIQTVVMHVVQPNSPDVDQIQSVQILADDVRKWGDIVHKAAIKATKEKNAPLTTGEWCRFCPAAGKCPALLAQVNDIAAADFAAVAQPVLPPVGSLTIAQVANVMKWAPILDAFVAAIMARALDEMSKGALYPGFKLVRKKTNREWPGNIETSQALLDKLSEAIGLRGHTINISQEHLLAPRKLASPKQVEGISKQLKEAVARLAIKPEGDLAVAPDSDPRDPVQPANDFKNFTGAEDLV